LLGCAVVCVSVGGWMGVLYVLIGCACVLLGCAVCCGVLGVLGCLVVPPGTAMGCVCCSELCYWHVLGCVVGRCWCLSCVCMYCVVCVQNLCVCVCPDALLGCAGVGVARLGVRFLLGSTVLALGWEGVLLGCACVCACCSELCWGVLMGCAVRWYLQTALVWLWVGAFACVQPQEHHQY
jgi:hypothetical protein